MAFKQMLVLLVVLVTGITAQAAETVPAKLLFSQLDLQVSSIAVDANSENTSLQESLNAHFSQGNYFSERELIEILISEEDDKDESNQKHKKASKKVVPNPFALTNGICFADNRNESASAEFTFVHAIQEKRFILINVFRI